MKLSDMEIFRMNLYDTFQKLYEACLYGNFYEMYKYFIFAFVKMFSIALDTLLFSALVVVFFKNYHWIDEQVCKRNTNKIKIEEQESIKEIQISVKKINIKKIVILMVLSIIYIPLLLGVVLIMLETLGLI